MGPAFIYQKDLLLHHRLQQMNNILHLPDIIVALAMLYCLLVACKAGRLGRQAGGDPIKEIEGMALPLRCMRRRATAAQVVLSFLICPFVRPANGRYRLL